jgi:hemerythrin-like domain-containing protein
MPVQIGGKPESAFDNPLGLLSDCHRRIEHFLEILLDVAETNSEELGTNERKALEVALRYFREAAPKHTLDEEESLFPRMRAARDDSGKAFEVLDSLHREHEDADAQHRIVDEIGCAWLSSGRLGPADRQLFQETLSSLQGVYRTHIALEDTEVFPLAGRMLDSDSLEAIGREMAARRGVRVMSDE